MFRADDGARCRRLSLLWVGMMKCNWAWTTCGRRPPTSFTICDRLTSAATLVNCYRECTAISWLLSAELLCPWDRPWRFYILWHCGMGRHSENILINLHISSLRIGFLITHIIRLILIINIWCIVFPSLIKFCFFFRKSKGGVKYLIHPPKRQFLSVRSFHKWLPTFHRSILPPPPGYMSLFRLSPIGRASTCIICPVNRHQFIHWN